MNRSPHVVIVGAGAIGGYHGVVLKRAGCTISVTASVAVCQGGHINKRGL